MKNQLLIICLFVICFGCSRKSVPVNGDWVFPIGRMDFKDTSFRNGFLTTDSAGRVIFQVEVFKVGKGDSLFRKIVVDSSWVDVK